MNSNRPPIYAFAYARVSDPRQAQKDVSVPEQLKKIRSYADRENIVVLREFADRGRSAYRDDVHKSSKRHKLRYYCSTVVYEGKHTSRCIHGVSLLKELIEGYVFSEIQKRFGTPSRIKELKKVHFKMLPARQQPGFYFSIPPLCRPAATPQGQPSPLSPVPLSK